jgi:tryptophan synthase beta chain
MKKINYQQPNKKGYFGLYGGRLVPPELEGRLTELTDEYNRLKVNKKFKKELAFFYKNYANRPSLLYLAQNLTNKVGGAKIYLKREDLNFTGAHKINNTIGQVLVAKSLGKKKLMAETGAGQHGLATATVAAFFGMECQIFMGSRDIVNQKNNVDKMRLLGAEVIEVKTGRGTLREAVDAALGAYIADPESYYLLGSAVGPHPYPMMVRDFQKIIGIETKKQIRKVEGRLPDYLVAVIGGGSNAIGLFYDFIKNPEVKLVGVEPAGRKGLGHGMSLAYGKMAAIHGFNSRVLKNSYSAASGLDYPGVGPEHCYLKDIGRLQIASASDKEAVVAFRELMRTEGIVPALESAHALAYAMKLAKKLSKEKIIVVNLSGRGDKDADNVINNLMPELGVKI